MMLSQLIRPRALAEFCGDRLEQLLNTACENGITLKNIRHTDAFTVTAEIYEREIPELEALSRRCMCRMEIKARSEGRGYIKRRAALMVLLLLTAAMWVLSGFFIWRIDVRGNRSVSRGEILRALSKAGLDSGAYRPSLDPELIRSRVLPELEGVSWMGISLHGSVAEISIIERECEPELFNAVAYSDIIAARSGVITKLSVLSGKPLCAAGQAAAAGELLVSGTLDSITAQPRAVRSSAEIMADTWYELTMKSPAVSKQKSYTGREHSRFSLIIGKKRINFYFDGRNNIDECDKIIYEYKIGIEGVFCLPVTLVRESMREYKLTPVEKSPQSLEAQLKALLLSEMKGEIIDEGYSSAVYDGVLSVTLRAHCNENIAVERKHP